MFGPFFRLCINRKIITFCLFILLFITNLLILSFEPVHSPAGDSVSSVSKKVAGVLFFFIIEDQKVMWSLPKLNDSDMATNYPRKLKQLGKKEVNLWLHASRLAEYIKKGKGFQGDMESITAFPLER